MSRAKIKTVVINPKFQHLEDFISKLPEIFALADQGEVIYQGRNMLKVFTKGDLLLNVKRYRVPNVVNRYVYMGLRKPKGERAYRYALRLGELGINTPTPIAFMRESRACSLGYSYFVSMQMPHSRRFYEFADHDTITSEQEIILDKFGKFTAHLHKNGVYHKDYSPGNILFENRDGEVDFCIIDINRMRFGKITFKQGCANFARIWGPPLAFEIIANSYAREMGYDPKQVYEEIYKARGTTIPRV